MYMDFIYKINNFKLGYNAIPQAPAYNCMLDGINICTCDRYPHGQMIIKNLSVTDKLFSVLP